MFLSSIAQSVRFGLFSLLFIVLTACGGGGSSGGSSAAVADAPSGTVGLLVTDAPTDDFQQINLTVTKAELISDSGAQTIFTGSKTFNLLELENVTELFAINDAPAGAYSKIRLTLEAVELVLDDGSSVFPKLPGNGKLDLNPKGTFFVDSNDVLLIQLDFDANKSIQVVKTGDAVKYNFRPVVFVKIIRNSDDSKLVRITGTANELAVTNPANNFELCDIRAQQLIVNAGDSETPYCVMVETTSDTSFFDENGDPADFSSLVDGETVTIFGRFSTDYSDDDDSSSEANDDDSNSKDIDSNSKDKDENNSQNTDSKSNDSGSEDDDSSDDNNGSRQLVLVAEVVMEEGSIETINGISLSNVSVDPDTDVSSFAFDPEETAEVSIPELLGSFDVILQRGTRIYSRDGTELDASDIVADLPTQVDGVKTIDPAEIKAAVIVITVDESHLSNQLTGTIASVEDDFSSIVLITERGAASRCVNVEDAKVFLTELNDENTIVLEEKQASDLADGQLADVFGDEEVNGCLKAHTVIYQQEGSAI